MRHAAAITGRRSGQALVEFLTLMAFFVLTTGILALLLFTFKQFAARTLGLAGSEFP